MSAKCKDKFLVQSTIITPERETVSLTDIWSMIEKEDKSQIYEQKIKCAFLPPASAPVPEENEDAVGGSAISEDRYQTVRGAPSRMNGSSGNGDDAFSSPQMGSGSPQTNGGSTMNPIAAASNAASNTNGSTMDRARNAAAAAGGAAVAAGGAAAGATRNAASRATDSASSGSDKDMQAEITRLKEQLADATKRAGNQTMQAAEGVPVHIVAAIAFGIFAITYLFF